MDNGRISVALLAASALAATWIWPWLRAKIATHSSEPTTGEILAFLPRLATWCDANGINGHHTWIAIRQRCSEIDTPLPGDGEVER